MPLLLPEYLSQPIEVVIQSIPTDLWSIGGTVFGAAVGAGVGGWVAYKGTLKANRSLVNQSKLEDCLSLVDQMRNVHEPVLRELGNMPKAHGLTEAKAIVGKCDPDEMLHLGRGIHTLAKLHAKPILMNAERLVVMSLHTRSLFEHINNRLGEGSPDNVQSWRESSSELANAVHGLLNQIESYLVEKAKT